MKFSLSAYGAGLLQLFVTFCGIPTTAFQVDTTTGYTIFAEWKVLDYLWDEAHSKDSYLASGDFIPSNNALAGIKLDANGNIYVTVPRWKSGVPATLNQVVQNATGQYVLSPWPSWDIQRPGVDGDLQNCQSMTIDDQGRMWVIEVGRRNFEDLTAPVVNGPAGVWLLDVASGAVLSKYYFPGDVVSPTDSFLNDIVLDQTKQLAYLTDAWGPGGLIVYDHVLQSSRRFSGPSTGVDSNYVMIINGVNYGSDIFTTPVDGIAITDDAAAIFYCSVQGTELYRVPTSVLSDFSLTNEQIDAAVLVVGSKAPSDGMLYRDGMLYFGSLTESTYYALPISSSSSSSSSSVSPSETATAVPMWPQQVDFRWVDTFAPDLSNPSNLWFVSNSLDLFFTGGMEPGSLNSNFRIIRTTSTAVTSGEADCSDDDQALATTFEAVSIILAVFLVGGVVIGSVVYYRMKRAARRGTDDFATPLI